MSMKRRVSPNTKFEGKENWKRGTRWQEKCLLSKLLNSFSGLWVGHGDICAIPWVSSTSPGASWALGQLRPPWFETRGCNSHRWKFVSESSWLCQAGFSLSPSELLRLLSSALIIFVSSGLSLFSLSPLPAELPPVPPGPHYYPSSISHHFSYLYSLTVLLHSLVFNHNLWWGMFSGAPSTQMRLRLHSESRRWTFAREHSW